MPLLSSQFQAPNLKCDGMEHAFFTREGGVSKGIYASLNCGRGSRDERADVEENRARVAACFAVPTGQLFGPRQIHSPRVETVTKPWLPNEAPEADAIVTSTPGLAIGVLTADCTPILLADPNAGVAAAIHAGWKGAKGGVIRATLEAMAALGAQPQRVAAAIGPTISSEAYEVGPEFRDAFLNDDAANAQYFSQKHNQNRPHFNLPAYVKVQLEARGVTNIHDLGLCTYRNESLFFSHRRSVHARDPDYGRQISAILIA